MAGAEEKGLALPWQALLIAIPAFAVYELNDRVLAAFEIGPEMVLAIPQGFYSRLEPVARLPFLAAFLLFAGVAAAVISAFATALWSLGQSARSRFAIGATALAILAAIMLWWLQTPGIAADIGLPSRCPVLHPGAPPVGTRAGACAVPPYPQLLWLLVAWKYLLIAATVALIFGTICCLADAPSRSAASVQVAILRRQAKRLNLFLNLSAMLLVSSLLVQVTFLRWPRPAISDPGPFDAHVSAIILYYGVGYSVFLASYYVPVAYWLGRRAEQLKDGDLRDEILRAATIGPARAAKAAATILAPALAGLLTASIDLLA